MAKKLSIDEKIAKHLKAIKTLKTKKKEEKNLLPLSFSKDLEKLFATELKKEDYTKIFDLIKQNKETFMKTIRSQATPQPKPSTPQQQPHR